MKGVGRPDRDGWEAFRNTMKSLSEVYKGFMYYEEHVRGMGEDEAIHYYPTVGARRFSPRQELQSLAHANMTAAEELTTK